MSYRPLSAWVIWSEYVDIDELQYVSRTLNYLDEQDEDSDIAAGRESGIGLARPANRSAGPDFAARQVRSSRGDRGRGSRRLDDHDTDEDDAETYDPRRAKDLSEQRVGMLTELTEVWTPKGSC